MNAERHTAPNVAITAADRECFIANVRDLLGSSPDFEVAIRCGASDCAPGLVAIAAHRQAMLVGAGWIVGNNAGKWRTFDNFGWAWTDRRDLAVRYARREDAELVHSEDEDSWVVEPYPDSTPETQAPGPCFLCAGKCRGHGLADPVAWEPEVGSVAALARAKAAAA